MIARNQPAKTLTIAVVVNLDPKAGGAYTYEKGLLKSLKIIEDKFNFLVVISSKNFFLEENLFMRDHKYLILKKTIKSFKSIFYKIDSLIRKDKISKFEKIMRKNNVDLILFSSPSILANDLNEINFITTIWDLGHRHLPEFVETAKKGTFEWREKELTKNSPKAYHLIVDTEQTKKEIESLYGLSAKRITPIKVNAFTDYSNFDSTTQPILDYQYIYYPAQFWSHKGHIFLIRVFEEAFKRNPTIKMVFTGSDQGNLKNVENEIKKRKLHQNIINLKHVSEIDRDNLMTHCAILIYPSRLGNSNIPPLDAEVLNLPTITSTINRNLKKRDNLIMLDNFDTKEWVKAILKLWDEVKANKGERRMHHDANNQPTDGVKKLENIFFEYLDLKKNWLS